MKDKELPIVGFEPKGNQFGLRDAFAEADAVHKWIAANGQFTQVNYLTLSCNGEDLADNKWAASFDSSLDEEWYESADAYPFGSCGASPEEAISRAAMRVKAFAQQVSTGGGVSR